MSEWLSEQPPFKVGDRVRVNGPAVGMGYEVPIPFIGTINALCEDGDIAVTNPNDCDWWWYHPEHVQHLDAPTFKLGDVVQLKSGGPHMTVIGAVGDLNLGEKPGGSVRTTVEVTTGEVLRSPGGGESHPDNRSYADACLKLVSRG